MRTVPRSRVLSSRHAEPFRPASALPRSRVTRPSRTPSPNLWRFVASVEQPLHAEADPEEAASRAARCRPASRHGPTSPDVRMIGEVADAGQDDLRGRADTGGIPTGMEGEPTSGRTSSDRTRLPAP